MSSYLNYKFVKLFKYSTSKKYWDWGTRSVAGERDWE